MSFDGIRKQEKAVYESLHFSEACKGEDTLFNSLIQLHVSVSGADIELLNFTKFSINGNLQNVYI
jgi:hypothetical protein